MATSQADHALPRPRCARSLHPHLPHGILWPLNRSGKAYLRSDDFLRQCELGAASQLPSVTTRDCAVSARPKLDPPDNAGSMDDRP